MSAVIQSISRATDRSISERFADFAVGFDLADVPAAVIDYAKALYRRRDRYRLRIAQL